VRLATITANSNHAVRSRVVQHLLTTTDD
jgi:hypothetical protein